MPRLWEGVPYYAKRIIVIAAKSTLTTLAR